MSQPSSTPVRPPQVTVACGIAMVGSVFVVVAVWDRIAGLHSIDTRDALSSYLDSPMVKGSGLTLSGLIVAIKVVSMVAAGCATAIAVLGFQTLRRSRTARLAMTVLAVPMFVGGLAADGIFSSGVAAAVATLWFGPARLWFQDARTDPAREQPRQMPPLTQQPPPTWTPPVAPQTWAPPPTSTYDVRRHPEPARPNALLTACLLTWMFCSLTVLLVAASLAVLAADSRTVLDRMHEQDPQLAERGLSDHDLLVIGYVTGSLVIVWALVAAVLAIMVFRRRPWAWYALLVSTSGVVVLGMLAVLGFVLVLVPLVAAVTTIALLLRTEVRAWLFSR